LAVKQQIANVSEFVAIFVDNRKHIACQAFLGKALSPFGHEQFTPVCAIGFF
jgi:hypothetical protein